MGGEPYQEQAYKSSGVFQALHRRDVSEGDCEAGRYLDEMEWQFNNRRNLYIFRDTLARVMHTYPLQYRDRP